MKILYIYPHIKIYKSLIVHSYVVSLVYVVRTTELTKDRNKERHTSIGVQMFKFSAFNKTIPFMGPSKACKLQTSLELLLPRLNSWPKSMDLYTTKASLACLGHSAMAWTKDS